jgi:glycosyltransferase involved in cell wall biosynthesis
VSIDLEPVTEVPAKEKTLTFIFLARLVKMKGIEDALHIIAQVKKTTPEVKLWVVGGGDPSYVSHLQDMTKELGIEPNVEFKGRVSEDEKVRLLRRAHWLLHTSMREGFGLTVLEANSQGTPVIAYNSHGLNEVVSVGINGYLVDRDCTILDIYLATDTEYQKLCLSSIKKSTRYSWQYATNNSLKFISNLWT